ncbi:MAG: hypothetical protein DME42_12725 [Verrucomicrobia bacterium]|nr:MAG: hypothetical protein DME42_12725 [Verrucomicrobiota bacterium]
MNQLGIRSPSIKIGGIVYFGRMLDKIRLHDKNELPTDYQANLGRGFDEFCIKFLDVQYHDVVRRVREGGTEEEILWWCFDKGRRPTDTEIYVWNEFMRKRRMSLPCSTAILAVGPRASCPLIWGAHHFERLVVKRCRSQTRRDRAFSTMIWYLRICDGQDPHWPHRQDVVLLLRRRRVAIWRQRRCHSPIDKFPDRQHEQRRDDRRDQLPGRRQTTPRGYRSAPPAQSRDQSVRLCCGS